MSDFSEDAEFCALDSIKNAMGELKDLREDENLAPSARNSIDRAIEEMRKATCFQSDHMVMMAALRRCCRLRGAQGGGE